MESLDMLANEELPWKKSFNKGWKCDKCFIIKVPQAKVSVRQLLSEWELAGSFNINLALDFFGFWCEQASSTGSFLQAFISAAAAPAIIYTDAITHKQSCPQYFWC